MYEVKSNEAANQTWGVTDKGELIFSIAGGEVKRLEAVQGEITETQVAKIIKAAKGNKKLRVKKEVTNG
jgi:hypothetical protein